MKKKKKKKKKKKREGTRGIPLWESVVYQIIYDSLEGIYLEKWLSPFTISVTNDLKFLSKLVSKSDTTVWPNWPNF